MKKTSPVKRRPGYAATVTSMFWPIANWPTNRSGTLTSTLTGSKSTTHVNVVFLLMTWPGLT